MKTLAVLLALAATAFAAKPNIVILYADDLGGFNADSKIPTPHLDKLAAEGMRFTRTPHATKEGNRECRPGSDRDFYKLLPALTVKGMEYIRARKDKAEPFFLYFPLPSPHAPTIPKIIKWPGLIKPDDDSPLELYDMEKDTGQRSNLAAEHPEIAKEMQKLLAKTKADGHSAPRLD